MTNGPDSSTPRLLDSSTPLVIPARAFAAPRSSLYHPLGDTGLSRWGGVILEEPVSRLSGVRWHRILREMMASSPVVKGMLFAIEMLIRRAEWHLDPADDGTEAADVATLIDTCRTDMQTTWEDALASILSFLPYGYSLFEVIHKQRLGDAADPGARSAHDDGLIGWRDWSPRSQATVTRWYFDDAGHAIAFEQQAPMLTGPVTIPLSRCLHFRTGGYTGSPEGTSILRAVYPSWDAIRVITWIESVGIERDLAGYPVAWVPSNVLAQRTDEERASYEGFQKIVTGIRVNDQGGAVMPLDYDDKGNKLYDLTLLSTGGQRSFDTNTIIQRHATFMTTTILADWLLLGHQKTGSYSLSVDKTRLFTTAIQAWLDSIGDVLNEQAIRPLLRLNGIDLRLTPTLRPGDVAPVDLKELGDYLTALSGAGMLSGLVPAAFEGLTRHVFDVGSLPLPEEGALIEEPELVPALTPGTTPFPPPTEAETTAEEAA